MYPFRRMADGKHWTTHNPDVKVVPSYCYEDPEIDCLRYGRLYTWESALRGCQSLGERWRLPTNDEWRQLGIPLTHRTPTCRFGLWRITREPSRSSRSDFRPRR